MFCTNCGNEIKEGTLFCTECGTPAPKLEGAPVAEPVKTEAPKVAPAPQPTMQVPPTATAPAPKKKGNGPLIAIIILIVALVLGGGAFALVSSGALDEVLSGFSSDKEDDDDDDDDKDKDDDDEEDDDDKSNAGAEDDTSDAVDSDRDGYGLVQFDDVDSVLLSDVIAAYMEYCYDNDITEVTLLYYNADQLPDLYCHDTDVLVYAINIDAELEEISSARSTLLVYGHNVTSFVKSASVDDAYQVLTDPNYMLENADYILPNSSTEYLTKEDLAGLTKEQLRIARNEIFARHGRMFDSEDLQEYFNSKAWYTGTIPADEFNLEEILNDIEKANADLIKEVEAEMEN